MKTNLRFKRVLTLVLAFMMLVTAAPVNVFAQDPAQKAEKRDVKVNHKDIEGEKSKFVNNLTPAIIARPDNKTSKDFVKDPDMPAIYTLRTDYKAEKGEKYSVNYQPYVASVGAAATQAEKDKINKLIKLPDMAGYDTPKEESFTNSYDEIVKRAKFGNKTSDNGDKFLALREYKYKAKQNNVIVKHVFQDMDDFNVFSNPADIDDPSNAQGKKQSITKTAGDKGIFIEKGENKFPTTPTKEYDLTNPDQKAEFQKLLLEREKLSTQKGNTGSTLEVQALPESQRPGFEPQTTQLKTQVPEDTSEFKIEYRYNRAHYDVVFDTQDGTPLATRTYYYDQEIPKIDENSIPTKRGSELLGWKPSHNLKGKDGRVYKKDEIIKDANGNAIVDLGNTYYKRDAGNIVKDSDGNPVKLKTSEIQLMMPALKLGNGKEIPREKLTFTAVWKDKEKSSYAVQFWAEKADHADNASLSEKYEYVGTHVYNDVDTGTRPNLDNEPVNNLPFPDLDQTRLEKIWAGEKFYADRYLYLNKFFVYNKELTDEKNKDPKNPSQVKDVLPTDETVYNIYYDRQVYDLYFTKSNALSAENTFYPEIYVPDGNGGAKLAGGPGNPYHYTARFNQLMLGWPNDAMQTKGFDVGKQSYGWGPNYGVPEWPLHLDTPPYRLNADEFLDMAGYDDKGGYVDHIDKGDGTTIDVKNDPRYKDAPYKALSFGIKQEGGSMPHHMDFWMDGFKSGETIIRYDLYRSKADTNSLTYGHKYSKVQGFTAYGSTIEEGSEEHGRVGEDDIDALNEERGEITPYPDKEYTDTFGFNNALGQMHFRAAFFSNADEFGDPDPSLGFDGFTTNGYIRFKYHRNKYPLRFNYDPSIIRDDSYFNSNTNKLDTFYEFPLKVLSPNLIADSTPKDDRDYYLENPRNLLDDANNLEKLGLTDLLQKDKKTGNLFQDKDGNYKVKRPDNLSDQMVFKGWALDPAGTTLVRDKKGEKMPSHAVNLYAKWGEPDYRWKVTIDPNGGKIDKISKDRLTTDKKTVVEGDIDKDNRKTYPKEGYEDPSLSKETNEANAKADKAKGYQVFTVIQRQKLNILPKPTRYGYDFLGWEVIHYKKDAQSGDFTNEQDTSYRDKYKVPELYSFGTDVVAPIYLKAIWVENKRAEIKVYHYYLKNENNKLVLDKKKYPNPEPNSLDYKRVDDYVPTTGEKQDEHWILADNDELMKKLSGKWTEQIKDDQGNVTGTEEHDLLPEYKAYNDRVKLNNTFFQTFRVQDNINVGTEQNPVYKPNPENVFRFYYRPFRTRNYKVNYIDVRGKEEIDKFLKDLNLTDIDALMNDDDYKNADDDGKEAILLEANKANKAKFKAKRKDLDDILDKYKIFDKEKVTSECRHYDARNYRRIPGWALVSDPQQQLFYDVNEKTNEFLGINHTGADEIFFYYQDARVIETKKDDPTPDGYVRVTFKIDPEHKGGVFEDKDGKKVTELYYDVIKGLKSDNLPHPVIWEGGKDDQGNDKVKEVNRYYITEDQGKSFKGWDNEKWLNEQTDINRNYTFTAYFDWSGLTSSGLVRTEAYKDPNNKWTNDFAPKLEDLKKQLVWREKDEVKPIPADVKIKFFDGKGNELNTDEDVYKLIKEKNVDDATETVRTEKITALALFKTEEEIKKLEEELKTLETGLEPLKTELENLKKADPQDKEAIKAQEKKVQEQENKIISKKGDISSAKQELDVSVIVYKNRYEALNIKGDKPEYLSSAEKKPAKDGGLKDILANTTHKRYIKVTVDPTEKIQNKDAKVYYVNPNAWVEIPEIVWTAEEKDKYSFLKWTADQDDQNEKDASGTSTKVFDFAKRHKFTEDTVITPIFSEEAVEQKDPNKKPDVPETYVKVIVKTTDKATDATKFEKTFWVNPTKEVTITVTEPKGKENQEIELKDGNGDSLGKQKVNYIYKGWQIVKTGEDDTNLTDVNPKETIDLAKNKYTAKVTVVEAIYEEEIDSTPLIDKSTISKLDTPKGKEITPEDLKGKITPPAGKEIASIEVISVPSKDKVGEAEAKVVIKYTDGSTEGSNDHPITIPVEVHDNIIPAGPNGEKPEKALANYKKVILKPGDGGKFEKTLSGNFIYYVSPEVEVDLTNTADNIEKTPFTGYIVDGGKWTNKDNKALKGTFTEEETVFEYNFKKTEDIVEKTNDPNQVIPKGYVKVTFRTEDEKKGKLAGDITEKIYYVNPDANITLKVLADGETIGEKQLAVPKVVANTNFTFNNVWQEPIDETTPITSDRTHVAIFEDGKVTLTYDAGGADVTGDVPAATEVKVGTKVRLADQGTLTKPNAVFDGWKLDNDENIYKAGAEITLDKNRTATAQWTTNTHKVEFDTDGGSKAPDTQKVEHGKTAKKPDTDPTKENFVFTGWKEEKNASETDPLFDFANKRIVKDLILFAQWTNAVQEINEGDAIDKEKFIKVTFLKGDHGTLTGNTIFKVAKGLSFDQAVQAGLKVPAIVPAKYYKAKDANKGWDQALELKGEDITFTAQYELEGNVIPVDKEKDDETLKAEKPEDMVLVTFKVDENKAFMTGDTKFYVKRSELVNIEAPKVYPLTLAGGEYNDYVFKGWSLVTDDTSKKVEFDADFVIDDAKKTKPDIRIRNPRPGSKLVFITDLTAGAQGYLVVMRNRNETKIEASPRGSRFVFVIPDELGGKLNKNDKIKIYAIKDGIESDTREYRVK